MNSELQGLVRSYARLAHDVGGRINFAHDLNNDDAIRIAEQEKVHLDHAFFVLSFAALEKQITLLASARIGDENRRKLMRDANFKQRWDSAVKVAREVLGTAVLWETVRPSALSWYEIRNKIAHGQSPSELADVPTILDRANEVAGTYGQVAAALKR